jgi:hypothetical protein
MTKHGFKFPQNYNDLIQKEKEITDETASFK